jgi:hypothetical protein
MCSAKCLLMPIRVCFHFLSHAVGEDDYQFFKHMLSHIAILRETVKDEMQFVDNLNISVELVTGLFIIIWT